MKELKLSSFILHQRKSFILTAIQHIFLISGKFMQEQLTKKVQEEDVRKYWSGEITIKDLAKQYGLELEETREFLLYKTEVGKLILRNIVEFRQEISKLVKGEIKQIPLLITAPLEEATKVFNSLSYLFENSQETAEKLSVARELREYIKLIISFHESGIIEDKEKKLTEMKRAHKEVFY